jgi:hypothetical protein
MGLLQIRGISDIFKSMGPHSRSCRAIHSLVRSSRYGFGSDQPLDYSDKPEFRYGQLGFDMSEVQFSLRALPG